MDVKFIMTAECRVDNIDKKQSQENIAKMLEELLLGECGIKANVEISGLTYINEAEGES